MLNPAVTEQKCKQWTLRNLVPSNGRIAPLGKYLCALANSLTPEKDKDRPKTRATGQPREPSARRRRLHILYVLNDIFYHVKFRDGNDNFADKCEGFLPTLIRSAASFPGCPKHTKKIRDLISLWEENGYFDAGSITKFRAAVEQALAPQASETSNGANTDGAAVAAKARKEAAFVMPAMHGDPTMPWYDLPAANWLPVLEPNSTRPMKPYMVKPLQLSPGPADKMLVEAVKKLLADVDNLYSGGAHSGSYDIDQMGEIIETDETGGDVVNNGETYYGWSHAFCEKMRARRKKARSGGNTDKDQRSSRSYSRSCSRSPDGRSRSISRGPGLGARDDSRSRGRSLSRPGFKRRRSVSDSRSPPRRMRSYHSRSRSMSRRRSRGHRRSSSRSRSRSRSRLPRMSPSLSPGYSPPSAGRRASPQPAGGNSNNSTSFFNPPPFARQHQPPPPPRGGMPPYPGHGSYHPQAPPPAFPVPPPLPPQNYNDQWPPPPPPPPPQNFFQAGAPAPPQGLPPLPWGGAWPPAPPVPGVGAGYPQLHQHQQSYPPQQYRENEQNSQQPGSQPHGQYGYGRGGAGGYQGGGGGGGQWRGGWA